MDAEPAVAAVTGPDGGQARQISSDGMSTYVVGTWDAAAGDAAIQDTIERLQERFDGRFDVRFGGSEVVGNQVVNTVKRDLARAELFAFPLLAVLSLLVFRGVVAALLPLLLGGLNIAVATAGLRLVNEWTELSIFAMNLVSALGLGLAIDYTLLIVSRFRSELSQGHDPAAALRTTLNTAGRTVLLSAVTVGAAMACLFVFDQRFLDSMAVGGVLVAASGAVAALVILPALLAVLGSRVNAWSPRRWRQDLDGPDAAGPWQRVARAVVRRPVLPALVGTIALLVMAAPIAGVDFTTVSAKDVPSHLSARQVDDALALDFPANPREDVVVVAQGPAQSPAVEKLADRLAGLDDAAQVSPVLPLNADTSVLLVDPRHGGTDERSLDLVRTIRSYSTAELPVEVGGESANFVDLRASIEDRLPEATLLVVLATMVVLWLLTGSVLLPVLSVVLNTLTLAATYGVLVVIFQTGHLSGLLGFTPQHALDVTMPVLLFALVFGLSTDYGVFLLARIREFRESGLADREAVVLGVAFTGRIVTAAALLFCVALGALVTSEITFIKQLGLGTALGVMVDATVVRVLLVPSLLVLAGRATWWAPKPAKWLHERIGVSEGPLEPATMREGWS